MRPFQRQSQDGPSATNSYAAGVGANYRASCRARSRAEFIAKIGVVEEEADESAFWMELIIERSLLPASKVEPLLNEANELVAIMASSRISAKRAK
ncbi:MAG: four helix bundle protein [Acidobacteriota bacterium]